MVRLIRRFSGTRVVNVLGVDLSQRLLVLHGLLALVRAIGGRGDVVVEPPLAGLALGLGSFVAVGGVGRLLVRGGAHLFSAGHAGQLLYDVHRMLSWRVGIAERAFSIASHPASILITPRCRLTAITRCLSESNSGRG